LRSAFAFASFQKYENTIRNQIQRSRQKIHDNAKPKHSSTNAPQKNNNFKKTGVFQNSGPFENFHRTKIFPNLNRASREKTNGPRDSPREWFGEIHN
jgi:hypothetical protein